MQALTVSAVVSFLREVLEANEYFSDLWIVGEVSSFNRSQLGHRYFSLRDPGGALRAVMFRDTMPGTLLRDGERVLAHGRLTFYTGRGDLQYVVDFVRPEGVGILAAKFEELRLRLEREGLFATERKRTLPRFPARIGVVTSPTGAALQDVKNVLAARWPAATLVVAPAMVQGPEAPAEVASAIRALAEGNGVDVLLVVRGGGSTEDLSAFNSEAVARAIFASPVPIVSGVGHETDVTIADMVADVRAPTPSAAVERATPDRADMVRTLAMVERAMASAAGATSGTARLRVDQTWARCERSLPSPELLLASATRVVGSMGHRVEREAAFARAELRAGQVRLGGLDPMATLARGFAIVQRSKDGKVVNCVRRVRPGDRLNVSVSDGAFWTEVS